MTDHQLHGIRALPVADRTHIDRVLAGIQTQHTEVAGRAGQRACDFIGRHIGDGDLGADNRGAVSFHRTFECYGILRNRGGAVEHDERSGDKHPCDP